MFSRSILYRLAALVILASMILSACAAPTSAPTSAPEPTKAIVEATKAPVLPTPTTPPPAAAKFEDQFGTKFATDFRAGPNTEPADVAAGDVIAVNPTAEPVPFSGT